MTNETTTTTAPRYCINCAHALQRITPMGEWYCKARPGYTDPVTGRHYHPFAQLERADADKCGPDARNYKERVT